jgi:hypothetical protein
VQKKVLTISPSFFPDNLIYRLSVNDEKRHQRIARH